MTKKSILENNKLIAKFMNWTFHPEERDTGLEYIENTWSPPNSKKIYVLRELRFHKSWNLLMPVVEKIESLDKIDKRVYFKISGGEVFIGVLKGIQGTEYEFLYQENGYFENSKINAVYKAVVEFIKWYNQNKNKL